MRAAVAPLLLAGLLLAPERAEASGCVLGPFVVTPDAPLGCPVKIYVESSAYSPPTITAVRGAEVIDVTGVVAESETTLDVLYQNFECDGTLLEERMDAELYVLFEITLAGAQVGDKLAYGTLDLGTVQPAGPCSEQEDPMPFCSTANHGLGCEDETGSGSGSDGDGEQDVGDPDGGCNAGHASGLVLGLGAMLALRRRRRAR